MTNKYDDTILKYYEIIEFNNDVIQFLKQEYLPYGASLAHTLLDNLDLSKGNIATFVPKVVERSLLRRFNMGYYHSVPVELREELVTSGLRRSDASLDEEYWILPMIRDFLQKDSNNFCFIEDHEAGMDEKVQSPTQILTYNNEVYQVLNGRNITVEKILETFRWVISKTFICILTSFTNGAILMNKQALGQEDLYILARNCERIIISVYDQEGYLVWSKE